MQMLHPKDRIFITVDAETEVISDGVRVISSIRRSVEEEQNVRLPIVWFVRFQRTWMDSVHIGDPEFFESPVTAGFDGFALAKEQWIELSNGGDEIGWHYHAHNYVHRDDLSHDLRMRILEADLKRCADAIRSRHPEFDICGFRFGWFFVPDFEIFRTLSRLGIRYDASVEPERSGKNVKVFQSKYLDFPETGNFDEMVFFRSMRSTFVHDWTLVPFASTWKNVNEQQATENQTKFRTTLERVAVELRSGKRCTTYKEALVTCGGQ